MTAIIEREDDGFVSLCPELDVASQGSTIEEARANLVEALQLLSEAGAPSEVARRLHSEVFVTQADPFIEAVQRGEAALARGESLTHEEVGARLCRYF